MLVTFLLILYYEKGPLPSFPFSAVTSAAYLYTFVAASPPFSTHFRTPYIATATYRSAGLKYYLLNNGQKWGRRVLTGI